MTDDFSVSYSTQFFYTAELNSCSLLALDWLNEYWQVERSIGRDGKETIKAVTLEQKYLNSKRGNGQF